MELPTNMIIFVNFPDSQDLFHSSSDENVSRLPHEITENSTTFRKQVNEPPNIDQTAKQFDPREINTTNSIFRQQKTPTTVHAIPTLIDSDPPELNDVPSSIKTPYKPANLFLDDENDPDDFSIFDDKTAKNTKQPSVERKNEPKTTSTKAQIKSINLFADDDSDNFDFLPSTSKATAKTNLKRPEPNVTNLFENDDDDDDELFLQPPSEPSIRTTPRTTILANAPKKDVFLCNLFDDEPPDDDFLPTATAKAVQSGPSSSKQLSDKSPIKTLPKSTSDLFNKMNLFDDDDDDDDGFEQLITPKAGKKETPKPESKIEIDFDIDNDWSDANDRKDVEPTQQVPDKPKLSDPIRLFDDEPPSDDDKLFSSVSSKKAASNSTFAEPSSGQSKSINFEIESDKSNKIDESPTQTQATNNSKLTGTIRLFDDTPLSDDDDDEQLFSSVSSRKPKLTVKPTEVRKQSTGVFYNDFSETITSIPKSIEVENLTDSSSNKISGDLNQAVDDKQLKKEQESAKIADVEGSKTGKRSDFLKKIDAFSNAAASNEQKIETTSPTKVKPPKKLNIGNIDINVAALLPGAKRSKSIEKSDMPTEEVSDEKKSDDQSSPIAEKTTISKVVSQDNVDSSGRLVNLNRSRAKNLSRRPSTRAGRKQQYQKSMDSEEQIEEQISNTADKTDSISEIDDKNVIPANSIVNLTNTKINRKNENVSNSPSIPQKSPVKELNFPKIDPEPTKIEPVKNEPSSSKIHPDDLKPVTNPVQTKVAFDDDLFEIDSSPKLSRDSEEIEVKLPAFLDEPNDQDDSNEDPFSFLNEQNDENDDFFSATRVENVDETTVSSYSNQNTISVKATPAYIDELPPDLDADDEKPFDGKSDKGASLLSENALSLFGDDDDDFENDDIFNSGRPFNQPGKLRCS